MISPALAGQIVTGTITVCVCAFGISEIIISVIEDRKRQRIESQEILKDKVDRFTGVYGLRSEDPDDQAYEALS